MLLLMTESVGFVVMFVWDSGKLANQRLSQENHKNCIYTVVYVLIMMDERATIKYVLFDDFVALLENLCLLCFEN